MKMTSSFALVLISFFVANTAFSQASISPFRFRGESFESAMGRQTSTPVKINSVLSVRKSIDELDRDQVPKWTSDVPIEVAFQEIRDRRFIADARRPSFLRRLSWLFPDDGCYVRAEMAAQMLEENGFGKPAKIFVFGDLRTATEHHPDGAVEWWYHVVVGYQTDRGLLVFDPAVFAAAPLTLEKWATTIGSDERNSDVTFSLCDRNSFDPDSSCKSGKLHNPRKTSEIEQEFLNQEWSRQLELGRNPLKILGDEPPWAKTRPNGEAASLN